MFSMKKRPESGPSARLTQFLRGSYYCPLESEMAKCCCDSSVAPWEMQCEMAVGKDRLCSDDDSLDS